MTHEEKVEILHKDLGHRGVSEWTIAPPLYRLLWRVGLEPNPPLFASFWSNMLTTGALFAIFWGIFQWWLIKWEDVHLPVANGIGGSVVVGFLFGVIMACSYRWRARKLALPRWEHYPTKTQQETQSKEWSPSSP